MSAWDCVRFACSKGFAESMLLLASLLPAQRVWVVDEQLQPGADFASIQAAVDAAAQGDVIHVRPTSPTGYVGPVIQGKNLTIVSEPGGGRAIVGGQWTVQGVLGRVTVAHLDLMAGGYQMLCTGCPGTLTLEDLNIGPSLGGVLRFTDCSLVMIRRCTHTAVGGLLAIVTLERCAAVSITDSTIVAQGLGGQGGTPALDAYRSKVVITGSTLRGANASASNPSFCFPAIYVCSSDLVIGAGSLIDAGRFTDGSPTVALSLVCSSGPVAGPARLSVDWSAITATGPFPAPGPYLTYLDGVQTGLSVTQTATTLQATQHCNPPSLTVLALGSLTTTPWTNVVGPVFVDPNGILGYFDAAPASGPVQRSFAIPPGLPPGTSVALQAFELMSTGRITTSNVCVVGIW